MDPIKSVVGAGGATVFVGGSYLGYAYSHISKTTIKDTKITDYELDTLGKVHENEFVAPFFYNNERWWNHIYSKFLSIDKTSKQYEISEEFKKVKYPFQAKEVDTDSEKYLNKACDAAFKKKAVRDQYLKNIWRYCSNNPNSYAQKGGEPTDVKTLKEKDPASPAEATKLGGVEANKALLVDETKNKDWWNWVFANILEIEKNKTDNGLHADFQAVIGGYGNNNTSTDLNKVCATQYEKTKTDFSDDPSQNTTEQYKRLQNVKAFCTKGGNGQVTLPT